MQKILFLLFSLWGITAHASECDVLFSEDFENKKVTFDSPTKAYHVIVKRYDVESILFITDSDDKIIYKEVGNSSEGYQGFFNDPKSVNFSHGDLYVLLQHSVYNPTNIFTWYRVINLQTRKPVEFKKNGRRLFIRGKTFFINGRYLASFSLNTTPPRPLLFDAETGTIRNIHISGSFREGAIPYENATFLPETAVALTTGRSPSGLVSLYFWNFLNILSTDIPRLNYPILFSLQDLFSVELSPKILDLDFVFLPLNNKYYGVLTVVLNHVNTFAYLAELDPSLPHLKNLGSIKIKLHSQTLYSNLKLAILDNKITVSAKPAGEEKRQIILRSMIQ